MTLFWVGHFEFFCFISMKRPKAFLWGIIYFCTMDGFFRILEKTSSELICTRLYILDFYWNPFIFSLSDSSDNRSWPGPNQPKFESMCIKTATYERIIIVSFYLWSNTDYLLTLTFSELMSSSCHIQSVEIVVELGIFVFFKFSAEKKLQPNFAFWDTFNLLRCLNSKEIKLQSSIRVICILFDLISVQLKI